MKSKRFSIILSLMVILGLLLSGGAGRTVQAQSEVPGDLATMVISSSSITWIPQAKYERFYLTVASPDGQVYSQVFEGGKSPALGLKYPDGGAVQDGMHRYDLVAMPVLDAETLAIMANTTQENREEITQELRTEGKFPSESLVQSGTFYVEHGKYLMAAIEGSVPEEPQEEQLLGGITPMDVVTNDDSIITGSLCVGFDCVDGESFGFDTLKLKENNLGIYFDDTSTTAGFPANDWRLVANDSASGGNNYFTIQDATASRDILKIEAGAPANAFYIEDYGRIGLKTSTPVLELHINDSDTPGIRLEQNGSGGWTPQTWDVAGNEANFFIRDVTSGSKLPFRIYPGASTNSLIISGNGYVGVGTVSPTEKLHVAGNIRVDGYVVEFSDVNVKMGFVPVDGSEVLARLMEIPVSTWSYKAEGAEVRHMGPMSQDFYAAFGLGADDKHIAALDSNGVALAAIQELARMSAEQDARISALEAQNADLEQRVEALEQLMLQLVEGNH